MKIDDLQQEEAIYQAGKLSRSKIELFLECPKCFYLEVISKPILLVILSRVLGIRIQKDADPPAGGQHDSLEIASSLDSLRQLADSRE